MMKTTPIATAAAAAVFAGVLMAACGGMPAASVMKPSSPPSPSPPLLPPPSQDAVTALERACLLDPTNATHWARLATALEAGGQRERAARFYQQAATLSAHDARRDYALLAGAAVQASAPAPALSLAQAEADPDADIPRTQVRQLGAALVQVVRVDTAPMSAPMSARASSAAAPSDQVRLEISNGNGVTGAAARLARTLDIDGVTKVRLTNARPFTVARTRIEYPQAQHAMAEELSQRLAIALKVRREGPPRNLRIVLGHDSGGNGVRAE